MLPIESVRLWRKYRHTQRPTKGRTRKLASPRPLPAPSPQRVETRAVRAHHARVSPDRNIFAAFADLHVLASLGPP